MMDDEATSWSRQLRRKLRATSRAEGQVRPLNVFRINQNIEPPSSDGRFLHSHVWAKVRVKVRLHIAADFREQIGLLHRHE